MYVHAAIILRGEADWLEACRIVVIILRGGTVPVRADHVVHIGPSVSARGGIAGVIRNLLSSQLGEQYELTALSTVSQHKGLIRFAAFPVAVARLVWMFAISRPAAVHVHTASWGSFPRKRIVIALASRFAIPVILHIHGGGFAHYLHGRPSRVRAIRRALQRCCVVIVLSESMKAHLVGLAPEVDIRVIPNAVAIPATPAHGINGKRLLFVGRPVAEKGVAELLDAMGYLVSRFPDATLDIAGEDAYGALELQTRDLGLAANVRFRGWLDSRALHAAYDESSIFVLPSHVEAMPVSLLEAMSHGLACVVTPVGAMPDIIADSVNGIIVPVNDSPALASAIEMLLRDENQRRRLGEQARTTVAARYSLDRVIDLIGDVYHACGIEERLTR